MAWNDLSIPQRSQLMNMFRRNGVVSLSEMKRLYDLSSSPSLVEKPSTAPVYADGGVKSGGDYTKGYKYYPKEEPLTEDMFNGPNPPYGFYDAPLNWDDIEARQHYAESRFHAGAESSVGARGPYQIMPDTWEQYSTRLGLDNIEDYNENKRAKDALMKDLYNSGMAKKGFPSDSVRAAKALASYNWGPGNVDKFLKEEERKGNEVYHSMDWVDRIPKKQTREYVNFVLRRKDGSSDLTNEAFNNALPNRFDAFPEANAFKYGGNLFGPGGGLNPIPFSSILYNLKSILPTKTLKKAASRIRGMQHGSESLYPKRRSDRDPGDTFLLDAKRQKEELGKLGYTEGVEGDYGLVSGAVNNLISDTHKAKVPVYQLGVDDAARDTLQVIYNGIYPKDNIPEEGQLIHAGSYPFAIYKGNNSNTYFVKSWDLNDYGKHGDSGGTTYGSRQFLADLYDKVGSPFVQTSGFKQIKDWDGKVASEDDLDISKETFKNIPYIKRQIEGIEALRADHDDAWDAWADQAIENLYTNYVNDLKATGVIPVEYRKFKSGGKIHIKKKNRGKFTALKKRTGHSASWFKAHGTPAQKKMAVFALNARKWKHSYGGIIF